MSLRGRAGRAGGRDRARTAPARRRCCRSSRASSGPTRARSAGARRRSAGCRSRRRSTASSRWREPAAVRPAREASPTSDAAVRADARPVPGCATAPTTRWPTLSGGNRQRVNIAIGLLGEPAGAAARRAERRARPAPARAAVGVHRCALAARRARPSLYSTHDIAGGRAPRRPGGGAGRRRAAVLRLAARARGARSAAAGRPRATSRRPSSPSSASGATSRCAGCSLKDLQILRRSPLLVALLVLYPIVIAVLIGFALSRGPDKPEGGVPQPGAAPGNAIELGGERIDLSQYAEHAVRGDRPGAR